MGLSNFQIGSSMVAVGMSVWQTMVAVVLGRIVIAAMAVLNGYVGAEWHIGYPVFSRILWGMRVRNTLDPCGLPWLIIDALGLSHLGLLCGYPSSHPARPGGICRAVLERGPLCCRRT